MRLWNYVHTRVAPTLHWDIHVWEFLALILTIVILVVAIVHGLLQKKRERVYEEKLDEMSDHSNPWLVNEAQDKEPEERTNEVKEAPTI